MWSFQSIAHNFHFGQYIPTVVTPPDMLSKTAMGAYLGAKITGHPWEFFRIFPDFSGLYKGSKSPGKLLAFSPFHGSVGKYGRLNYRERASAHSSTR